MANLRTILKFLVPLVLAILLTWYVLSKIDISILVERVSSADIRWVLLAIAISIIAHLSRAARWNILLEPLGYAPSLKNTFAAVMVGYFGNIFLPRGGEVMRCLVLTRIDKVPFNSSFGTVVAERAFDFICLLLLIAVSFLLEFDRFNNFFHDFVFKAQAPHASESIWHNTTFIVLFVFLGIGLIFRKRLINSFIFIKMKEFGVGILKGVVSIRDIKKKEAFILHTIIIWGGYFSMTYLMFFALPATSNLGLLAGLVILIVGGLGMSAPVSGGIGPFHIMVAGALQLFYGLNLEDGYVYAFVIHTSQLISVLLLGGASALWVLFARKKTKEKEVHESA